MVSLYFVDYASTVATVEGSR